MDPDSQQEKQAGHTAGSALLGVSYHLKFIGCFMCCNRQGCHSVRKSQENFFKMSKVKKKWGVLKKSQEKSGNLIKF